MQVESEETIFKKYDKSPNAEAHPSVNHPISQLCQRGKQRGWPCPVWELVNEKVIDSKAHRWGRHNTMLYTMKVTVWPGKGNIDPRVYFGSGPTKKDAKFACGSVAWADIEDGKLQPQGEGSGLLDDPTLEAPLEALDAAAVDKLNPEQLKQYLAQQAIRVQSETFKGFKRPDVDPDKWRELVARDARRERELAAWDKERDARLASAAGGLVSREGSPLSLLRAAASSSRSSSVVSSRSTRRSPTRESSRKRSRSRESRSSSVVSSRSRRSPDREGSSRSSRRSPTREGSRRRERSRERTVKKEPEDRERSRSRMSVKEEPGGERSRHRSSSTVSTSSRSSRAEGHDDRDRRDY